MVSYLGKRVLVTGATGFIGSHLVARLVSQGAKVTCVLRPNSSRSRFEQLGISPTIIRCELDNLAVLYFRLASLNPEFVFHLAAERDLAKLEIARIEQRSACSGSNVLESVSGDHLRRFISVGSSLETLNAQTGQPHGAYGKAKLKELQQLRKTAAKLGAAFSPTRTHYVYGPLQSPKKLIPMAIKAAQEGQPLKLTAPEISKRLIYVGDIIDALLQIPNQPASPDNVQLITSDQNTSNLEVVHQISKLMAKPIQIKLGEFSHREFDQPTWDISDAGSRLANWTAKTSLTQGLQYCIDATELANV